MKAITKRRYGGPEVLQYEEIEAPKLEAGKLLVEVKANSANPADWHVMRGDPWFARIAFGLFKPKTPVLGADFAGVVKAVGGNNTDFKVGDRVFGESLQGGAFAEVLSIAPDVCAKMPDHVDFTTMACVPIAGLTALQGLVTHGALASGESVLINGASGGVGHFAVQIAKALGAEVTGVCSSRNTSFVKALGADHVIAYDKEDIHGHEGRYDLVVDTNGNLHFDDFTRMGGRGVVIGFTKMSHMMGVMLRSAFSKFDLKQFTASANTEDLNTLAKMVGDNTIRPRIEKVYPSTEIPDAIGYIEAMRTRGKVAMTWD